MKPRSMSTVINRKRYSTDSATLIAGDDYWDGHNFERHGRQTYLYRTAKGAYFTVHLTQWQGEQDNIAPVSEDEAVSLYEGALTEHRVPYTEAFPTVKVEDA